MLIKSLFCAVSLSGCWWLAQTAEPVWDKLAAAGILAAFLGLWLSGKILSASEHRAQVEQWRSRYQEERERADKWERLCMEAYHTAGMAERTTETAVTVAEKALPHTDSSVLRRRKPEPPVRD